VLALSSSPFSVKSLLDKISSLPIVAACWLIFFNPFLTNAAPELPTSIPGHFCDPLPVGELTDEQLLELVPDNSPGRVRVRWATESQENVFGFNVMRAETVGGPWVRVNRSVIPGEGTTNLPKSYCYLDTPVERGKTFWYYIEEVMLDGQRKEISETKGPDGQGTKVTVRTVEGERTWLRQRALEAAKPVAADPVSTTTATTAEVSGTTETLSADPSTTQPAQL
jgi:hypothetical protein